MWKDILKLQIQQGGYAQLDFDNIIEEEEDNCKRKVKQISDNFEKMQFDYKIITEHPSGRTYQEGGNNFSVHYLFQGNYPEEVYCKVLELLANNPPEDTHVKIENNTISLIVDDYQNKGINYVNKIIVIRGGGERSINLIGYSYRFIAEKFKQQLGSKLESAFNVV